MCENYTIVTEHIVRGLCNHRLRFGVGQSVINRPNGITLHAFEPRQTFGMVRWKRNDFGTMLWNLYICEAAGSGRVTEIPGVTPGAHLLFRSRGTKATRRLLARLTRLEKRIGGDLSVIPANYWRKYNDTEFRREKAPVVNPILECSDA